MTNTRARRRLAEWIKQDSKARSKAEIGRRLNIAPQSVLGWLTGASRPEAHLRKAIETMTSGFVAADDWEQLKERKSVEGVVPFTSSKE